MIDLYMEWQVSHRSEADRRRSEVSTGRAAAWLRRHTHRRRTVSGR